MKERERLQTVGSTTAQKKDERRERFKAKVRARAKIRTQKILAKTIHQLTTSVDRLKIVQQELDGFNPRFHQLQTHSKTKWSTELNGVILELTNIISQAPKD